MLAHKAVPEGRLAAEVIAGKKHYFDPMCIPSVAYTDPEVAWTGVTEIEAKAKGIKTDGQKLGGQLDTVGSDNGDTDGDEAERAAMIAAGGNAGNKYRIPAKA